MQAVILSGGQGTRLRPITHATPKQLVPIGGRSVLAHVIADVIDAGIDDIIIVASPESRPAVATLVETLGAPAGIRIVVQPEPNGLAAALAVALEVSGDVPTLLYLGDCLVTGGVGHVVEQHRTSGASATLLVAEVDDPSRYGIVELGVDGRVRRMVEKPAEPESDLAIVGVYAFGPEIGQAAREVAPSARGEYEITDAIQLLVDAGAVVTTARLEGWWIDTGTIADVFTANRLLLSALGDDRRGTVEASTLEGPVRVEPGARLVNCRVTGPVIVAAGATVRDSVVGPNVTIGADARVDRATIAESILMDAVTITDASLRDTFLGSRARVSGAGQLSVVAAADTVVSLERPNQAG